MRFSRRTIRVAVATLAAAASLAASPTLAGVASPFSLNRITIWSNGDKPGRLIGRGEIPSESLPVDLSAGLVVSVNDAGSLAVVIDFDATECQPIGPRRAICRKIVAPTKRQRVKIHQTRDGEIRFYFQNLDVQGPLAGPVNVTVETATGILTGTSGGCVGGARLLHCR